MMHKAWCNVKEVPYNFSLPCFVFLRPDLMLMWQSCECNKVF